MAYPVDDVNGDCPQFDIIIIGAGTAGCVLANRLTEDHSVSVLLLERGENRNADPKIIAPGLNDKLLGDPDYDWRYESTPQSGLYGKRMNHPRGKVVGGTSAINSFALIYPSAAGIDEWASLDNSGWDWKGLGPYFRKFQTLSKPNLKARDSLVSSDEDLEPDGGSGPIKASLPGAPSNLQRAWVETFRNAGLENVTDPLDGNALGGHISTCHISNDTRERSHAGNAYYEPVKQRQNLKLVTGVHVTKINFDAPTKESLTASGVTYTQFEKDKPIVEQTVKARKEVILAAGVFASPQLLELSGIGSSKLLQEHGIPVLRDLPSVGENLQDHIRTGRSYEATEEAAIRAPTDPEAAFKQYMQARTGPLAERACYTFSYMPLPPSSDLQVSLDDYFNDGTKNLTKFERLHGAFIRKMIESPSEATATAYIGRRPAQSGESCFVNLFAMLAHPFSRGNVHIQSASPFKHPVIDFKYYENPLDSHVNALHVQQLDKIAQTKPLSEFLKPNGKRLPEGHCVDTLEATTELIKRNNNTNYHPCGTCAMMSEDLGGVVDSCLRVYGTSKVRVVDASIFPIIPRGNIVSTLYAVAEKAADIISRDHHLRRTL